MKRKNLITAFAAILILLLAGAACSKYATKLEYNGGELYYTKNVSEAEAKKFGDYLVKIKYFEGKKTSVQLDKSGSTYQTRFVINKEKQNDEVVTNGFKTLGKLFSEEVFGGAPIEVHICDDQLKTQRIIKP
jgi:hypothetical protein